MLKFFGGVVGLRCFGLDHHGSVAALVKLALVGDGPDNIATRDNYHGCHNDGHNQNSFHNSEIFNLSDCKDTSILNNVFL